MLMLVLLIGCVVFLVACSLRHLLPELLGAKVAEWKAWRVEVEQQEAARLEDSDARFKALQQLCGEGARVPKY